MGMSSEDLARLGPQAQRQILGKLGAEKGRKYHNEPVFLGPLRFDSKKEARRFEELAVLFRSGKIQNLKLQPQFTLQESYITSEGERIRAIRYIADFSYVQDGKLVVEDVKSRATKTREYLMKKKLLREKCGIDVREV